MSGLWSLLTDGHCAHCRACLKLIPHQTFTFSKLWILAANLEVRGLLLLLVLPMQWGAGSAEHSTSAQASGQLQQDASAMLHAFVWALLLLACVAHIALFHICDLDLLAPHGNVPCNLDLLTPRNTSFLPPMARCVLSVWMLHARCSALQLVWRPRTKPSGTTLPWS